MKCLCHSAHLCASHACKKLPRAIEDFIRDIYSHFAHSAKRLSEYKKFQHFAETEPHKILKPAQTRWLSLEQCIQRVLEQWSALELYFEQAAEQERLVSAQNILRALKNPIFKLYYLFLAFVLPKFTHFNKLFQSETPNIHFITNYLASTYRAFLSCYLSPTYIHSTTLDNLDPACLSNFVPLTSMNMDEHVANFLTQPHIPGMRGEITGFLEHVQLFYVETAIQIKQRFPINDEILNSCMFHNPETINSTSATEIIKLASNFPNIIAPSELRSLDDEWRELQFMNPNDMPTYTERRKDIVSFWGSLGKMTNTSGQSRFPITSKLTKSLLSFPHSNADVE